MNDGKNQFERTKTSKIAFDWFTPQTSYSLNIVIIQLKL